MPLRIRHRVQYQTRHTYATLILMAGANPMWVARMLGHATMAMVLNVYSKWIDGADKKKETQKIESVFLQSGHQIDTKSQV